MLNHSGALRTRLAILFGIVLLAGGALMLWVADRFAQRSADEAYDKLLESAAVTALDGLSMIEGELHFDLPYAALATLALSKDDRVRYSLINANKNHQVLTGNPYTTPPDTSDMQDHHRRGQAYFFNAPLQNETFRFVILERLLLESDTQEKIYLQMGQSRLAREQLKQELMFHTLLGIVGLIILGGLFVWLAVSWSLRPLLKIEQELLQRQPTDLKPLNTQVPSEAAPLVDAINRFMARLQANQDRNHAFIAEATHQLRTPLASLQAQAELATETQNSQQLQERSQRILRNARETNSRINQLLSYATLAHRADILPPESIELGNLIEQILADLAPLALQQHVELSFDNHLSHQYIKIDPEALREVLRNLIDNALKYGQQDSQRLEVNISLTHASQAGWAILQVRDYGAGIPEEFLQQVTRRFGRGEFRQHRGSGLGLAIVEQIIHSMGGRLELENGIQGGLKARLYLQVIT